MLLIWDHEKRKKNSIQITKISFKRTSMCKFPINAGIEMKFKNMKYPVLINPSRVPELSHVETTATGIRFGGAVTLTRVDEELKDALEKYPGDQSTIFVADLHTHLTSLQLL